MRTRTSSTRIPWIVAAVAAALSIAVNVARFHECRAHGFSRFYCLTQR